MKEFLFVCLTLSALLTAATVVLLTAHVRPWELKLWHRLQVQALRRWVTKRRSVNQPLDEKRTVEIARKNLLWHLVLTFTFATQIARSVESGDLWWCIFGGLLILPCLAYFAGSPVQRQKIAIIQLRKLLPHDNRVT
jgi:hypothetical protein